jgi:hypothetical protein
LAPPGIAPKLIGHHRCGPELSKFVTQVRMFLGSGFQVRFFALPPLFEKILKDSCEQFVRFWIHKDSGFKGNQESRGFRIQEDSGFRIQGSES